MLNSKRIITLLVLALLTGLTYATANYYKHDVYEAAIAYERDKASLATKQLSTPNLKIAYLESPRQANQETLILLHGFGATKENWLRFAADLTPRYHIVAIDLPGHGESIKSTTLDYSFAGQVEHLKQIASALQLEKFHIAGNSMGGAIASLYAVRYPQQVQSVTLFDPAGIDDTPAELADWLKDGKNPLIVKDEASFDQLLDFAMEQPPFIPWPVSAAAAERAQTNAQINQLIFSQLTAFDRAQFKAQIQQINVPTLIIWGTQDRVIHVANADVFEQLIPNANKIILPGIGHAPMIEVPSQTARMVADFIERNKIAS